MFDRYTHFALINNGMRGPFVVAEDSAVNQHWAAPFIGLLGREVKLAGNYLSCELGVHLQGPFLITDRCAPNHGSKTAPGYLLMIASVCMCELSLRTSPITGTCL